MTIPAIPTIHRVSRCRVLIGNHLNETATIVESSREPLAIFCDLAKMVKAVNRRRDETLRASVHVRLSNPNSILLQWHCPHVEDGLAREIMRIVEPVQDCERLIREGGQRP